MQPHRSIVTPFQGIRYRSSGCSDLSALIAPPYDVISEQMQAELHARHPHNFVRVELPKNPDDGGRYQSACQTLAKWCRDGVMVREEAPAVYVLEQEFRAAGEVLRRRGVFCLVRLPEEGRRYVLSHEGTLAAARADRLELMRACQAMTSPVMVIHEDADGRMLRWLHTDRGTPQVTAEEHDGVRDRLWVVSDREGIETMAGAVGAGPLAIADGHHRFETAMAYRREMQAQHPGAPAEAEFNYALMLITSAQDPALAILPTHRLIYGVGPPGIEDLDAAMRKAFRVSERPLGKGGALPESWDEGMATDHPALAVYLGGETNHLLAPRDSAVADDRSVVGSLGVSIVHRHLLEPVFLGCDYRSCGLSYVTDAQEAVASVQEGRADAAVLLRPTRVADVLAVAGAGEEMPGKSTYFYPKVPAGLVWSSATASAVG